MTARNCWHFPISISCQNCFIILHWNSSGENQYCAGNWRQFCLTGGRPNLVPATVTVNTVIKSLQTFQSEWTLWQISRRTLAGICSYFLLGSLCIIYIQFSFSVDIVDICTRFSMMTILLFISEVQNHTCSVNVGQLLSCIELGF